MNFIEQIPEIDPLFEGSNDIDVKAIEGNTSLRTTLPVAASNSKLSSSLMSSMSIFKFIRIQNTGMGIWPQ